MTDNSILKEEEKVVFNLRALYSKYGYSLYKMSKFEEYELYIKNKEFLKSDRVITFNDTNGKLLALKPDVTLSIIKNGEDEKDKKQKVYYNENVYRISDSTHRFKEIMQAGLECIGDIDLYDIYEVISLASLSLADISKDFVIEVSNIEILEDVLNKASKDPAFKEGAKKFIEAKNAHDLKSLCEKFAVESKWADALELFVTSYGTRDDVIGKLEKVCDEKSLNELKELSKLLKLSKYSGNIKLDFSVVGDTNYYNGFVFRGYISGICGVVLSGGQYDKMMKKMGRSSRAIGFAIYLDLLEQLNREGKKNSVDAVILYDDDTDKTLIISEVNKEKELGLSVSVQKTVDEKSKNIKIIDIRGRK